MTIDTYPVMMNGTAVPFPDSPIKKSYDIKETVGSSEDGTDIVQIRRIDKMKLSCSYQLMGSWCEFFENLFLTGTPFKVKIYRHKENAYVEKMMRMRDYTDSLIKGAEKVDTGGVYQISFTLIEM